MVSSWVYWSWVTALALVLVLVAPHPATVSSPERETGWAGEGRQTLTSPGSLM